VTAGFIMSVRPYVGLHWTIIFLILYWRFLLNSVRKNKLGSNNDYGKGGSRNLYNEDLCDIYHLSIIIRATGEGE
jgi:hypothetical protein